MFRLSVCADTVFCELPFVERIKAITAAGFMVEFWGWQGRDMQAVADVPGVRIGIINGSGRGSIMHPDLAQPYLEDVKTILGVAQTLRCRTLNLLAGQLDSAGKALYPVLPHPATAWITAYKTLSQVAELAETHDVIYNLENLNTKVDHGGYALSHAEDVVRLLEQVGSPRIKMLFDIYHAQIEEGNVIELIRTYKEYLGYIHVADVPGRHEPGTGEINYPNVARALRDVGYEGTVGLEAFPQRDNHEALARFKGVFG